MTLKDLQLYKDNDKYYLSAIFHHEDNKGIYEMSVPKIEFPVSVKCELNSTNYVDRWNRTAHRAANIDFGFCKLNIVPLDGKDNFFTMTCLEEKIRKMTLAEIEDELGYKIELQKEN